MKRQEDITACFEDSGDLVHILNSTMKVLRNGKHLKKTKGVFYAALI